MNSIGKGEGQDAPAKPERGKRKVAEEESVPLTGMRDDIFRMVDPADWTTELSAPAGEILLCKTISNNSVK